MSKLPSGTITLLFTDIESSTPLWDKVPEMMVSAITLHHTIPWSRTANLSGRAALAVPMLRTASRLT